jgi:ABC-type nitrate/sulfonate/bicarbonate transport system permease component
MRVTLLACAVAFAIVAPLALASGFMLGETPTWERRTTPALALLMTTPKSVFLPVFILILGIGFAEKIIFAVALAYFIVVPTGLAAAKSVPRGSSWWPRPQAPRAGKHTCTSTCPRSRR